MSHELLTVPVGRAVEIMRAWAQHRWPMTVDEGVGVYTGLGFTSLTEDRTFFTSDMSPQEVDSFLVVEGNLVGEVSLRLSNWVPEEDWEQSLPKSRAAFAEYVRAYNGGAGGVVLLRGRGDGFLAPVDPRHQSDGHAHRERSVHRPVRRLARGHGGLPAGARDGAVWRVHRPGLLLAAHRTQTPQP